MKFRTGPPPKNVDFNPDKSWSPLNEPGPRTFTWIALPFGFLSTAAFFILWFGLTDLMWIDFLYWVFYKMSFIGFVILFIVLIIVQELIHAVFHPGYGLSQKSILGLWPSKGVFYAFWDDEWSRNRAILCVIAPFLILSGLPLLVCLLPYSMTPWLDENIASMLCSISLLNAFFSCADLMGARLFFWQIPANGIVCNKGFHTYWRPNY